MQRSSINCHSGYRFPHAGKICVQSDSLYLSFEFLACNINNSTVKMQSNMGCHSGNRFSHVLGVGEGSVNRMSLLQVYYCSLDGTNRKTEIWHDDILQ